MKKNSSGACDELSLLDIFSSSHQFTTTFPEGNLFVSSTQPIAINILVKSKMSGKQVDISRFGRQHQATSFNDTINFSLPTVADASISFSVKLTAWAKSNDKDEIPLNVLAIDKNGNPITSSSFLLKPQYNRLDRYIDTSQVIQLRSPSTVYIDPPKGTADIRIISKNKEVYIGAKIRNRRADYD